MKIIRWRCGQSLVELLVAIGIAAILLPALLTGLVASREGKAQQKQRQEAIALMEEAKEATRSFREHDWYTFAVNGVFHPIVSSSRWILSSADTGAVPVGSETINNFNRKIVISDAYRNASGQIVSSGETNDLSTKKIVITVHWDTPISTDVTSTMYLTRYLDNNAYVDTTRADFDAGTKASVKTQAPSGSNGEIVLSQTGGFGDWCTPSLSLTALDLPKNGVANAVSAAIGSSNVIAAAGTGDNSSGVSFASVRITDPSYPTSPVSSIDGTFDDYKTNSVFTETDYAYLGTDNNAKEIVIINLNQKDANNKYAEAGHFNAPGNGNGDSIATNLGGIGYMASGNKFYTFDLSSHSGSRPRLNTSAGLTLSGTAKKIMVVGATAYVVTTATANQLQIINVSDSAYPSITTSVSVPGGAGRDVFVNLNASRAYLATAKSATQREFFIVNLTNNAVLGSYDTGAMDPKGVIAVSGARAIVVGTGGTEYQVIDTSTENPQPPGTLLPACGSGLNIDSGINGVATIFSQTSQRAYSYIITGDVTAEFKTIEGGPGGVGGNYAPTGTFTSRPFGPTTFASAFNRFSATIAQPAGNDVALLVGTRDASGGSCPTDNSFYTFVGVNGSASPFQSTDPGATSLAGSIYLGSVSPYYINPGKCFKYRVTLNTSDSTVTPVFKEMTINYSP